MTSKRLTKHAMWDIAEADVLLAEVRQVHTLYKQRGHVPHASILVIAPAKVLFPEEDNQ